MDGEGEDNCNFNGKYQGEKYVFGDRKVFKDFVRLLQKSSAYWGGVHPERIIGSGALPRRRTGHFVLLVGWNEWARNADHLARPDSQSTKNQLVLSGLLLPCE